MAKSFQFIVKAMIFEGLSGCVRERNMYQKHIKHEIKSFPNSVENRCEKDARKNDVKMMENCAKIDSKM